VHVTLRVRDDASGLRTKAKVSALRAAMRIGNNRFGFRLIHFSVQGNHLHLVCEADDRQALRRGLQGLIIRLAKRLNKELGRSGRVFADRYHARSLATPTEVRMALIYVLGNHRRHAAQRGRSLPRREVDPFSSALDFDGWSCRVRPVGGCCFTETVTAPAQTWLLRAGWKRAGGLLDPGVVPGS
jgi:REP element-mobilizing transposase RayT